MKDDKEERVCGGYILELHPGIAFSLLQSAFKWCLHGLLGRMSILVWIKFIFHLLADAKSKCRGMLKASKN